MNKIIICFLLAISPSILISQHYKKNKEISMNQYCVKNISIKDSAFYKVLDGVLQSEEKSKYYSPSIAYCIRVYNKENKNIVKIEGSDNIRLFIESEDLIGCFKYKGHDFFLLTECHELFLATNKITVYKIDKLQDIIEDDRWPIYYFGYDTLNYYFYERTNYVPR